MAAPSTALRPDHRRTGAAGLLAPTDGMATSVEVADWTEDGEGSATFVWRARTGGAPGHSAAAAQEVAVRLASTVVAIAGPDTSGGTAAGPDPWEAPGDLVVGRATLLRIGPRRALVAVELGADDDSGRTRHLVTLRRR